MAGRLDLPDGQTRALALFAHCFTCSKDVLAASRIANALTGFGIAVLRFDFTGLGGSGGDFANTNFTSNVADLVNAADYLRGTHTAPTILIGHSLGGAAVLAAAEHIPEVRAVATIGAPADTEHLVQLLAGSRQEIEEAGEAEICLAARTFKIRRQFLEDISHQPQADRIGRLDAALLVMHSPTDETVGIDNARSIFDAARHPKSFVSLDGADHLLTQALDARFAASVLAAWASRYLDEDAHRPPPPPRPPPRRNPRSPRGASRGRSSCPRTVKDPTASGSQPAGTCSVPTNRLRSATTPAPRPTTCCSLDSEPAPR